MGFLGLSGSKQFSALPGLPGLDSLDGYASASVWTQMLHSAEYGHIMTFRQF